MELELKRKMILEKLKKSKEDCDASVRMGAKDMENSWHMELSSVSCSQSNACTKMIAKIEQSDEEKCEKLEKLYVACERVLELFDDMRSKTGEKIYDRIREALSGRPEASPCQFALWILEFTDYNNACENIDRICGY